LQRLTPKIVVEAWHQNVGRGFLKQNVHRGLDRKNVAEAHPDKSIHRIGIGNKNPGRCPKNENCVGSRGTTLFDFTGVVGTVSKDEAGQPGITSK
jgi:hypothetical protein